MGPQLVVRPRHVLAVLAREPEGGGYRGLAACGADPEELAERVDQASVYPFGVRVAKVSKLSWDPALRGLVSGAAEAARGLGQAWVGTMHLLLALTETNDQVAARELRRAGVTGWRVRDFVVENAERDRAEGG